MKIDMKTPETKPLEPDTMNHARDPFNLASLPDMQPPCDGWVAISAGLQQQRRRRQQWISGLALAASITLVLGVVALLPQADSPPPNTAAETAMAQQEPGNPMDPAANRAEPSSPEGSGFAANNPTQPDTENSPNLGPENLQSLQRLSQRLEQNLRYLRTGMGAVPAEMVVYQVELEDLVAQVDAAISQQPESGELWRQRVNLLMDLNQVYGVGLRRDEPYVASL